MNIKLFYLFNNILRVIPVDDFLLYSVKEFSNFVPKTGSNSPREKNLNQAYNQARDARLLDSGFNAHRKVRNKVKEKTSNLDIDFKKGEWGLLFFKQNRAK